MDELKRKVCRESKIVTFLFPNGRKRRSINVDAAVLTAHSDVFDVIFFGPFWEKNTVIDIPHIPLFPFHMMISSMFRYNHFNLLHVKIGDALWLYHASHMYQYEEGIQLGRRLIISHLNVENASKVHQQMKFYDDQIFLKICRTKIKMRVLNKIRRKEFFQNSHGVAVDRMTVANIEDTMADIKQDECLGSQATKGLQLLQILANKMEETLNIILPDEEHYFTSGLVALFDAIEIQDDYDDE